VRIVRTLLPGCHVLDLPCSRDARGEFVKTFHSTAFAALGLEAVVAECFYSISARDVVRGLHFQAPPSDHAKIVYCVSGGALDAVVDLRVGSPTYGGHACVPLAGGGGQAVYVPRGFAHGFRALEAGTIVAYHASTVHAPESDSGVRWDSAGIDWGVASPLVSERDARLVPLSDLESPFLWHPAGS
jgi:dTDP-4-dehydrorhamnose 3,5-epimerase